MIVQCKKEDVEKNGYPLTHSHATYRPSPVQCTGLVKKNLWSFVLQVFVNLLKILLLKLVKLSTSVKILGIFYTNSFDNSENVNKVISKVSMH